MIPRKPHHKRIGPKTYTEALAKRKVKDSESALRRLEGPKHVKYGYAWRRPRKPLGFSGHLKAKPDRALVAWSRKVRERDDYTCQVTGIRDVEQNVAHHVAPRSRRPDLRLDVDNGITVTPEAHQWIHDHPIEATREGWLSDETYEKARKAA